MSEYLELPQGPIHWRDYGGDGPTILMVHGLGGSLANWDAVGPRLTDGWRVVAMDLPGFGLSPPGPDWTLETHKRAVVEAIEHFGPPVILVGNSMGGLIAEMVAAERPDLVDTLVLVSPAAPPRLPDPHIHWPTARRLLLYATPGLGTVISRWTLASVTPRQLINESLRRITHKTGRVPLDLVEEFVQLAEIRSHLPWAADAIPKTGQSIRGHFLRRSRFVEMIRAIGAPTLVLQGLDDPIVSRSSVERLCYLRPDWTLVQMSDTGHTPQIDAPVRTADVIESWLAERPERQK